jgi:hypothetical protein
MKTDRIAAALVVLLLAVAPNLYADDAAQDHHGSCSNTSLRGTYGYSSQGFVSITPDISPALFLPWVISGVATFDGKGKIASGAFTINSTDPAGQVNRGTFTGTYAVNADCTGSVETDVGLHYDVVVLSPTEFVSINTDVGNALIVSGKKIRFGEKH